MRNIKKYTQRAGTEEPALGRTRGFTLVETLVAISILVAAVTGAFSAARIGINLSTYTKNQVIAFYLAQEGVEYIRNIRDNNGLASQSWLTGLNNCIAPNTCMIDAPQGTISQCTVLGICPLLKQDTNGFYTYTSGTDTIYRRSIQITPISATEASITVSISWQKGLVLRTFRVRENILNWQSST
jgi:prepilin-type N-terminal cleavage/methylation domain-containing protein